MSFPENGNYYYRHSGPRAGIYRKSESYRHSGLRAGIYLYPGSGNYNGLVLDRFRVKPGMTVKGEPRMTVKGGPGMTVKGGPGMTDTNETE
jgi:hypothetical protein